MTDDMKRVLILTGDAGFGHRSAAEALQKALKTIIGENCVVKIENPLNNPMVPDVIRKSQNDYDAIVKKLPELYKTGYQISDSNLPVSLMEAGFIVLLYQVVKKTIKEFNPDLVITTYPIFSAPMDAINKLSNSHFPFITVVTDLVTVHHVWFNAGANLITVPTEAAAQRAVDAGISPEKILKTGIPVDPQIQNLKEIRVAEIRKELGWQEDRTTILVVGSPRIGSLNAFVEVFDISGYDFQLALVASGNDEILQSFKQTHWYHPNFVYDFVENMPKLMRAADIMVCKAGGLITTESLASGLPIMHIHYLPGQEKGNVDFVTENGAGQYCPTPLEALKTLSTWLRDDRKLLRGTAENASKLVPPDAAMIIAEKVCDLLNQPKPVFTEKDSTPFRELLANFNIRI
jgi:1,2-diacylglycerol 3-beta-galactosyltransferase